MTRTSPGARWRGWSLPMAIALVAAAFVLVRANWTSTPDGDPALHLRLIKDIAATGTLPAELPYNPARIEEGGEIVAMFPYSYPPLYHTIGAVAFATAGVGGVLALNAISAGVIASSIFAFIRRGSPRLVAAAASLVFLTAPAVIGPFRSPYMEPVMLAFLFAGAWLAWVSFTTQRPRFALLSGLLLGLGLATRQNALFVVAAIGLVLALGLLERVDWRLARIKADVPWMLALLAGGLVTALPAMLLLTVRTGAIGYADNWLPGMTPSLAIDPAANEYIANITKPDGSPAFWLDRYRNALVYTESWASEWSSLFVIATSIVGVAYLHRRGGANRFFARWIVAQVAIDAAMLVTLHGNPRYVLASQILFHTAVAVGLYAVVASVARWMGDGFRATRRGWLTRFVGLTRLVGTGAAAAMILGIFYGLAPHSDREFNSYLRTDDRNLRNFRGGEYAEMGAWVNANTAPDAIILTPRAYTALLTWERNLAWVTFYGNAWVVDAIETSEPRRANEILNRYGVDYVLVSDPPGTYLDAVPADGMRSYLQLNKSSSGYFNLVHVTTTENLVELQGREVEHGLRLYEVKSLEGASREAR